MESKKGRKVALPAVSRGVAAEPRVQVSVRMKPSVTRSTRAEASLSGAKYADWMEAALMSAVRPSLKKERQGV